MFFRIIIIIIIIIIVDQEHPVLLDSTLSNYQVFGNAASIVLVKVAVFCPVAVIPYSLARRPKPKLKLQNKEKK
jgi:uncharacterized membrane protein YdjX (TVP38/TMEM64 family)